MIPETWHFLENIHLSSPNSYHTHLPPRASATAAFFLDLMCTSCFPTSGPLHLLFSPPRAPSLAFASFSLQLPSHLLRDAFPNCPILKLVLLVILFHGAKCIFTPSRFYICFIISPLFLPLEYKLSESKDYVLFTAGPLGPYTGPAKSRQINIYCLNEERSSFFKRKLRTLRSHRQ